MEWLTNLFRKPAAGATLPPAAQIIPQENFDEDIDPGLFLGDDNEDPVPDTGNDLDEFLCLAEDDSDFDMDSF